MGNYEGRSKCFATWYSYAPSPRLRVSLTASACMAATSSSLSLCANMTSSIKPEIRNLSLRRQRIGPSRGIGQVTRINNILVKIGRVFRRYDRGQTNTHTDTQTRSSQYSAPLSGGGGGVIIAGQVQVSLLTRVRRMHLSLLCSAYASISFPFVISAQCSSETNQLSAGHTISHRHT